MPRNIVLKARDPRPVRSLAMLLGLGADDRGWLNQLDTYFCVPNGRLKLREQEGKAELIHYERCDEARERECTYEIVEVGDPEALKDLLATALGVMVAVEKSRRLLLLATGTGTVRVHLDDVPGLGSFIELEAVADPNSDLRAEYRCILELRYSLSISDDRLVAGSYSDGVLGIGSRSPRPSSAAPSSGLPPRFPRAARR